MKNNSAEAFQTLYLQFKESQSDDNEISGQLLESCWNRLKTEKLGVKPSDAVMAALLLFDGGFRTLITEEEYDRLESIVTTALNHYHKIIHPNNPVGRKLVDAIKETHES